MNHLYVLSIIASGLPADITVNTTLIKVGDLLVVRKNQNTKDKYLLGRSVATGTSTVTVDWLTTDEMGNWSEGIYGKEKVSKKEVLGKIKFWSGSGQLPEHLAAELISLYSQ